MWTPQQPDPDRCRRRLELLAELSGGSGRERLLPVARTARAVRGAGKIVASDKLRELIAMRRRLAG
ncbi:hypothetical protein Cme02nite_23430 [Catellatospora methionotrophica]|uniref:Uncharacterized protein n=1 Tax=Catellatospora methionotrophica TaxID=121620 RepID=A0A8J3PDZ3_9ACTN|nr:hypothetical protein [Catellatospora methionotrophica]GIG14011.1 hypothetical protein Cme02nite_23430 [Catellatospora methionotrophica]